jgi:beta-aspartyl-peptidase (threonine type)
MMLAGEGAQRFARIMGLRRPRSGHPCAPRGLAGKKGAGTGARFLGRQAQPRAASLKEHPEYAGGTVGAAAVDASGMLAAATSTGGVT